MTTGLMRRLFSSSSHRQLSLRKPSTQLTAPRRLGLRQYQRSITDVRTCQTSISRSWFTSTTVLAHPEVGGSSSPPPDKRTVKLGKTIRTIHEHLPTLLASPLPQDILSPNITLHLFPSTHPHLPTVSGKIAYTAALWTAPVAWGRVPVVGNVKLVVQSERMIKNGGTSTPADMRHEKLIVRWKTCGKEKAESGPVSETVEKMAKIVTRSDRTNEEFCGLFIFEFDEEGRIAKHTIEHAEENNNWDTAKVISVTDWLLGRAWGRRADETPSLAFCKVDRKPKGQHRDPVARREA